jgi:hypothetical protein
MWKGPMVDENLAKYAFRLGWLQWRIQDVAMVGALDVESRQLISQFHKDLTELEIIAECLVQMFPALKMPAKQVTSTIARLQRAIEAPDFIKKCAGHHQATREAPAVAVSPSEIDLAWKDLLVAGLRATATQVIREYRAEADGKKLVRQYVLAIDDLTDAVKALGSQLP